MVSPVAIAVSGMLSAQKRVSNSADNIANQFSIVGFENGQAVNKPFQPQQAVQRSLAEGGVSTDFLPILPGSIPLYQPDSALADARGIVNYPNVDTATETVNQVAAGYDFKANARTFKTTDEMMKSLLNIVS